MIDAHLGRALLVERKAYPPEECAAVRTKISVQEWPAMSKRTLVRYQLCAVSCVCCKVCAESNGAAGATWRWLRRSTVV